MERFSHSRTISVRYKNYFKSLNKQRVMVNSTIFINRHPKITIHKTKQPTAFFFKWLAECDCMYNQGQANQFYQSDSRIGHHWTPSPTFQSLANSNTPTHTHFVVKIENWETLVIFGSHCRGMNVLPSIAPFKWKPGGEGVSPQKHVLGKCWLASRWVCYLARIYNVGTDRKKMKSSWTVLQGRIVGLWLEWRCEWTT